MLRRFWIFTQPPADSKLRTRKSKPKYTGLSTIVNTDRCRIPLCRLLHLLKTKFWMKFSDSRVKCICAFQVPVILKNIFFFVISIFSVIQYIPRHLQRGIFLFPRDRRRRIDYPKQRTARAF